MKRRLGKREKRQHLLKSAKRLGRARDEWRARRQLFGAPDSDSFSAESDEDYTMEESGSALAQSLSSAGLDDEIGTLHCDYPICYA